MYKIITMLVGLLYSAVPVYAADAPELIIGEERMEPGIMAIFEGAVKDHIMPEMMHLGEKETHVHLEARVNWDEQNIPKGTPAGGFIPYLAITGKVTNEKTGQSIFIDLVPHINLVDNFHYARNMRLPGDIADPYTVTFTVVPPTLRDVALHKDWVDTYGKSIADEKQFTYTGISFEAIAKASRR